MRGPQHECIILHKLIVCVSFYRIPISSDFVCHLIELVLVLCNDARGGVFEATFPTLKAGQLI